LLLLKLLVVRNQLTILRVLQINSGIKCRLDKTYNYHEFYSLQVHQHGDIYEVPDGKPSRPVPTVVPEWLNKVTDGGDENVKPPDVYIEHVLLPTRANKVLMSLHEIYTRVLFLFSVSF